MLDDTHPRKEEQKGQYMGLGAITEREGERPQTHGEAEAQSTIKMPGVRGTFGGVPSGQGHGGPRQWQIMVRRKQLIY